MGLRKREVYIEQLEKEAWTYDSYGERMEHMQKMFEQGWEAVASGYVAVYYQRRSTIKKEEEK